MARKRKTAQKKKEKIKKISGSEMEPLIDQMVELLGDGGQPRMTKALVAHHMGVSVYEAGKMAGYSDSYCRTRLSQVIKQGRFRERMSAITKRMPGLFRKINDLSLLHLGEAQVKAVKMYKNDPEMLIKYPQLARQIKAVSGLLDDRPKPQATVNVQQMQIIQQLIGDDLNAAIARDSEPVDGEIMRPGVKKITQKIKVIDDN